LSASIDTIMRSIHVYKIDTQLKFDGVKSVLEFVSNLRSMNPADVLLDAGGGIDFLFLSNHGNFRHRDGIDGMWIKFGWARKRGWPEALDARTGRTEILRISGDVYLFEPTHYIMFEHNGSIVLLHEFNQYAPRPNRLCNYIVEFYKRMKNAPDLRIRIIPRRLFLRNVENLLKAYDTVKSIRIELTRSAAKIAAKVLGEGETALESLFKFESESLELRWKSAPREELEITIDELLDMFYELEEHVRTFKVWVKKGRFGRSVEIDLKREALIFRKPVKLARDEQGNLLRSTDTESAVSALIETIDEVLGQL